MADDDVDDMVNQGLALYEDGKLEEAIEWFSRAADKGDAEAAYNAGVALQDLGRREEALESYRRAIECGHTPAHGNAGVVLEHLGDAHAAEAEYRRGVEAEDAGAAFNLGVLLFRRGDDDGAKAALARAAELGDEDAPGALENAEESPDEYDEDGVNVLTTEAGAKPDTLVPVEHWVYFPHEETARSAALAAMTYGFGVEVEESTEDGSWLLRATREIYPRAEAFARARHPLVRLALKAGGEYDGWEAPNG
jgi:tetratricopeptide (TPR) repeat protein